MRLTLRCCMKTMLTSAASLPTARYHARRHTCEFVGKGSFVGRLSHVNEVFIVSKIPPTEMGPGLMSIALDSQASLHMILLCRTVST